MSGGFIPESGPRPLPDPSISTSRTSSQLLLSLSPRQEDKLRIHLDERLLSLERDERKHAFGSLANLLARLLPLLHLILQIPPLEPWSALRISYLLTFTGSIPTYITFLPLISLHTSGDHDDPEDGSSMEKQAGRTLRALLDFLGEVDRGWMAVLRGDGWLPPVESGGGGKPVKVDYGGSVGATERIRLRSIIITGREKILAWARTYGNFRGTTFPQDDGAKAETEDNGVGQENGDEGWEWEEEILGMWNGTLERLADQDFGADDAYA